MNSDLLNSCMELREAVAACFRVIVAHGLALELDEEVKRIGLKDGFGVRAEEAIAKAKS